MQSIKCDRLANMSKLVRVSLISLLLSACGTDPGQTAVNDLSSPSSFTITGAGTNVLGSTNYVFANPQGAVVTSKNTVIATISDPNLPLSIMPGAYSVQLYSGNCSSIGGVPAALSGSSSNEVTTQVSATGCSDQSVLTITLNTNDIFDSYGYYGLSTVSLQLTVDLAPTVAAAPTGNTLANGTGTTENTAGVFSVGTDQSILVGFSKNMSSGVWNASLTNCGAAVLGTPVIVGASGVNIAWPVTNTAGLSGTHTACTFNIAGVSDGAGNLDGDTSTSVTVTFN